MDQYKPPTKRDLEIALHNTIFRAEHAEQKVHDREHTLNLLMNGSFDEFYSSLTKNGATHRFSVGVARSVEIEGALTRKFLSRETTENRRIILWKTEFDPRGVFACGYSAAELLELPSQLDDADTEIKDLINAAIKKLPPSETEVKDQE